MQKITVLCFAIAGLLGLTGCEKSASRKPTPEAAQQLLKLRGYEFNERSYLAAAQAGDILAINAFFDAGINPNAQDDDGRTALVLAAVRGNLGVVNALLAHNVDVNVKDKNGYTALTHAVDAKQEDVVDTLLNRTELDPNARGLNQRPVLLAYVWRDSKGKVEKLLALGADVNAEDVDGDTALHGAARSGNVEILQMLLDKGALPNAKNKQGGTPLMWAAVYGNAEAANLLLNRGADASIKDNDGITAAEWATRNNQESVARMIRSRSR